MRCDANHWTRIVNDYVGGTVSRPIRHISRRFWGSSAALAVAAAILVPASSAAAVLPGSVDPSMVSAEQVLQRWVGDAAAKFDLGLLPKSGGQDVYRVSAANGRVSIKASTPSTALAGFNAYLGKALNQSVSWNSSNLSLPAALPAIAEFGTVSNVSRRFVNNDTEDGYTGAYRTLDDWKKLIDVYAMHGLNEVFLPVGSEAVYFDVFQQFGYTKTDLLQWIPQSGHQPWWLLQNMSGGLDAMTESALNERAALGKSIADYLRGLGMTPVLPGYFGTVPDGFTAKNPAAKTVPQGAWVGGYQRPVWLDPTNPVFAQVARSFYAASESRLGSSDMYKMDLLHEGGQSGGVNVPTASKAVEKALQDARPGAIWVLLGWQSNPPQQVVSAVNPATTFIVDGLSDRYAKNREVDWKGIPYAFGTIWNFGGHTTMGSQLSVQNQRYFEWLNKSGSAMKGLAVMPEAGENNPAAFDFFAGLAWRSGPADLNQWFTDFAQRRYGQNDPNAAAAWNILRNTAYDLPSSDGWSEAADGLFAAKPSLTVNTAASWSPNQQRYDVDVFAQALPALRLASPAVKATATYQYDLMDVARQVLSNSSRELLPKIKASFDNKNLADFQKSTALWLSSIDLMDQIAGTNAQQLLGKWIAAARAAGNTAAEKDAFERDARSLITLWSPTLTELNDYANREWNGLLGGYYKARWSAYFDSLRAQLTGQGNPATPDWNAIGRAFVEGTASYEPAGGYRTEPQGDLAQLAAQAQVRYAEVKAFVPAPKPLPDPPGAGVTQLSDLPFVDDQFDARFGPTARDTEVGDMQTKIKRPLTVGGVVYPKGLGVNSPSTVSFNLAGQCTQFSSIAGIDTTMDVLGKSPNVIFNVLADGKNVYSSGPFRGTVVGQQAPLKINLDMTGVKILALNVDPNGATDFDRADWADAKVSCSAPATALELRPELSAAADALVPGSSFTLRVPELSPGSELAAELRSDPIALGSGKAGADGVAVIPVSLPAGTALGAHRIVVGGTDRNGLAASGALAVTVVAAPPVGDGGTVVPTTTPDGSVNLVQAKEVSTGSGNGDGLATTGFGVWQLPLGLAVLLVLAGGAVLLVRRSARS